MAKRSIVVGDIHGCFDELRDLLDRVGFSPGDQLVAVGDIIDRGLKNREVLEFFSAASDRCTVMGNHERKHVRSYWGEIEPSRSQLLTREELGEDYPRWVRWMEKLPLWLDLPDALVVHGFFEPGVPVEQQRATVLTGTLSGERYLERKYRRPWYELYQGPKPLIVGHRDYRMDGEPFVYKGCVYAIDTGCVYGRKLSAVVLPGFRIVQVSARAAYWPRS